MASFHPSLELLQAYSAGHVHQATALAIATHLSFCAQCRAQSAQLNEVAGVILEDLSPVALATGSFDALLARAKAEQHSNTALKATPVEVKPASDLPPVLHKLMPQGIPERFTRIGWSLKQATLKEMNDGTVIALHHIRAGGTTPQHTHEGDEITVVLKGSFSDESGLYQPGDFVLANEHTNHRPMASSNSDCLCFTVQHAPLKLTGPIGRWFNPLLRMAR